MKKNKVLNVGTEKIKNFISVLNKVGNEGPTATIIQIEHRIDTMTGVGPDQADHGIN